LKWLALSAGGAHLYAKVQTINPPFIARGSLIL